MNRSTCEKINEHILNCVLELMDRKDPFMKAHKGKLVIASKPLREALYERMGEDKCIAAFYFSNNMANSFSNENFIETVEVKFGNSSLLGFKFNLEYIPGSGEEIAELLHVDVLGCQTKKLKVNYYYFIVISFYNF